MRIVFAFMLFGYSLSALGQGQESKALDSLQKLLPKQKESPEKCRTLNKISDIMYNTDPQKGIAYADQGYRMSVKINYPEGIATSYLSKGKNESQIGDPEKALLTLSKAKSAFTELGDHCATGLVLLNIGIVRARSGKFPEGLDAFFNAVREFEKCKGPKSIRYLANCHQNIANIYNATENYDKALANYDIAIKLFSTIPDEKASVAINTASKGMIYSKLDKNQEALDIFLTVEKELEPLNEPASLAYIRSWIGSAYIDLNNYGESLKKSEQAFTVISGMGDEDLIASTIQVIGLAHLRKGIASGNKKELELGRSNLNKSVEMHLQQQNYERLIQDYNYLSLYYTNTGDYKKSMELYMKSSVYKDSVFNFKNKQSLQNLEDRRTIELREKQLQISRLTIAAKERQKWIYIIGIALLMIIAGLVFRQSRNRRKTNRKLRELNTELDTANKVKARFFSILNHDLRSPVASLISFLHLQKDSPELLDAESRKRMEDKTISSAENLLESMEDILLWSKGQMEHFTPQPKAFAAASLFDDLQKHFSSVEKVRIIFEDSERLRVTTDINYIKTILRNLIGNAIRALENTPGAAIIVTAKTLAANVIFAVSDNGPGAADDEFRALYDDTEVTGLRTGLGLHLIRDLAKAIGCTIDVESSPGKGTTIALTLPPASV